MKKIFLLTILILLCIVAVSSSATKVFEYGFEDWGGDIQSTPAYPFGSSYSEYCDTHASNTEVIQGYNGKSAHSGQYYLMVSHGQSMMDPLVPGITSTGAQPYDSIGVGEDVASGDNCGSPAFDVDDISTGEYFIRFWIYTSDWQPIKDTPDAKLKCIRFYNATDADPALFYVKRDHSDTLEPYFSLDGPGDYVNGPVVPAFADENWHKVSMYYKFETKESAVWFDVDNETMDNATMYRQGAPEDGQYYPQSFTIVGNWSAHDPAGIMYHGIDDIEVWDGLPDGTEPPQPPSEGSPIGGNGDLRFGGSSSARVK